MRSQQNSEHVPVLVDITNLQEEFASLDAQQTKTGMARDVFVNLGMSNVMEDVLCAQ